MGQTAEQKYHERVAKIRGKYTLPDNALITPGYGCWVAYFGGIITAKTVPGSRPDVVPLQDIGDVQFRAAGGLRNGSLKLLIGGAKPRRIELSFGKDEEAAFTHFKNVLSAENQHGVKGVLSQEMLNRQSAPDMGIADDKFRARYKIPADAVLARAPGVGYISFDGHFVTIQHIGMQRAVIGKGIKRFPLTAISNIQIKPAGWVMSGYMQITAGGSNETRSKFGRQTWDASSDENTVVFGLQDQAAFLTLRDAIEQAQRKLRTPESTAPAPPQEDILVRLEKLGNLRDAGILTDEEFTAKKTELLKRL